MVDGAGSSTWQSNPRRAGDIGVRNENISSSRCTGLKLRDFRCACYAKTHWRSASRQAEHADRHPTGHCAPVPLRHLAHLGFVGYHQKQAMHGMEPPGHPGETVRYDCIKACERGPPPRQRVDSGVLGQFCPSSSMAAPALRRRWPLHSRARIAFKHQAWSNADSWMHFQSVHELPQARRQLSVTVDHGRQFIHAGCQRPTPPSAWMLPVQHPCAGQTSTLERLVIGSRTAPLFPVFATPRARSRCPCIGMRGVDAPHARWISDNCCRIISLPALNRGAGAPFCVT